jgi:hypothetical protein
MPFHGWKILDFSQNPCSLFLDWCYGRDLYHANFIIVERNSEDLPTKQEYTNTGRMLAHALLSSVTFMTYFFDCLVALATIFFLTR